MSDSEIKALESGGPIQARRVLDAYTKGRTTGLRWDQLLYQVGVRKVPMAITEVLAEA